MSMNNERISQMETLQTVKSYLETNKNLWEYVPIIVTYVDHLVEVIDSLNELTKNTNELPNLSGATLQQLRITIAEKMDILDDILESYAEDTQNEKLLSEADNSKSDYLRLTNDGFERKVTSVLKLLEAHLEEMKPYGISTEDIEHAKDTFHEYQERRARPFIPQDTSSSTYKSIDTTLAEGMNIVNNLSVVMVRFRSSHPSFYNAFQLIGNPDEIDRIN